MINRHEPTSSFVACISAYVVLLGSAYGRKQADKIDASPARPPIKCLPSLSFALLTERKMKKVKFFFIALFMPLFLVHSSIIIEENREIDRWFQKLHYSKPKLTHLHFYFHDTVSGPAQTAVMVVPPPKTVKPSTTLFGQVTMFDDPLTKGPEPTSKLLGRAQGLYGFASQEEISLLMAVTFVLTSGKHNGSGFTILGRNAVEHSPREFPIVGGTGNFRLARGFAIAKTFLVNSSVAIVEYNVAIMHY